MKNTKIVLLIIFVILILAGFVYFALFKKQPSKEQSQTANENTSAENLKGLGSQVNGEGGVSVEVTPIDFSFSTPVKLKVDFTTHQGNLDFDMTKISYLLDDKNNKYIPSSWEGGSGGHHISGALSFSEPIKDTKTIKFVIENVSNVEKREFLWEIK